MGDLKVHFFISFYSAVEDYQTIPFLGFLYLTLYMYFIMLSVKLGGVK